MVGVEGSVKNMEDGCSAVSVMAQECTYDEQ